MSDEEEKLAAELAQIGELASKDKKIDASILIESALAHAQQEQLPKKQLKRAYWVSLLLPPFGLYYAFKYFLSQEPGARRVGWVCLILTGVSLFFVWALAQLLFSSTSGTLQQLQGITPQQIRDLTQ
jgi:hypothetical protein